MWTNSTFHFHAGAWLLWLAAAMLGALGTRNPYYLGLLIGIAWATSAWLGRIAITSARQDSDVAGRDTPVDSVSRSRGLLLRAVVLFTVAIGFLKGLSLHIGTTVLFELPEGWPVIGGPITLESMVWSGLDAFSLLTVLAVFAVFSAQADYYSLLRSLPPFLHQVGLVTSIAITFVPQTVTRFTEIREAQALRGHRVRRVSDLLPLIMPLLAGGMERSMNLAEAMEARGFSRSPAGSRPVRPIVTQAGLALGIGLTLAGGALLAFFATQPLIGWATIALGIGLIAVTLRAVGRGARRRRYRRAAWRERDTALAAVSIGIIVFLLAYKFLAPSALTYYPFPSIHPPTFDPVVALALLGLAAPSFIFWILDFGFWIGQRTPKSKIQNPKSKGP
jgi:energy-coupling factor transport system permease protein